VKSTKNASVYFSRFLSNSFRYVSTFQHCHIYHHRRTEQLLIAFINLGPSRGPTPGMEHVSKTQRRIRGNTHVCFKYVFHGWCWATWRAEAFNP